MVYLIFWTLFFTIHFKYKEQIREVLLYFKRKAFRWIGKFINWEIKCFLTGALPKRSFSKLANTVLLDEVLMLQQHVMNYFCWLVDMAHVIQEWTK